MDVMKLDLYGILGVSTDATEKEILSSFRRQARKCHPDKNPDNPKAVELFHQLSKALEVLTDAAAKAAYDKILRAKEAAALRHKELDSKRKKFKEDLEARESAAESKKDADIYARKNLQAQIDRLRKEGSRLLKEEQERLKEELNQQEDEKEAPLAANAPRLKVRWKARKGDEENGGYNHGILKAAFNKYGEVTALLVSAKKNGSAVVEFESSHAALLAYQNEIGNPANQLTLTWISGEPARMDTPPQTNYSYGDSASNTFTKPTAGPDRDFENIVLMNLRRAQERKLLEEQLRKEDNT